jgi:hypothetical protein
VNGFKIFWFNSSFFAVLVGGGNILNFGLNGPSVALLFLALIALLVGIFGRAPKSFEQWEKDLHRREYAHLVGGELFAKSGGAGEQGSRGAGEKKWYLKQLETADAEATRQWEMWWNK